MQIGFKYLSDLNLTRELAAFSALDLSQVKWPLIIVRENSPANAKLRICQNAVDLYRMSDNRITHLWHNR